MDTAAIQTARMEAEEFIRRADVVLREFQDEPITCGTLATGALRRQSLELSRSLAVMRRPYGSQSGSSYVDPYSFDVVDTTRHGVD